MNRRSKMRAQNENYRPEKLTAQSPPIEFLTDNGFSIIRSWEIDGTPRPTSGAFSFQVRNPEGAAREIIVQISEKRLESIRFETHGRLTSDNSFWISCAERHLALYLWEKGDYPPADKLLIEQLDPDDLISAIRWRIS